MSDMSQERKEIVAFLTSEGLRLQRAYQEHITRERPHVLGRDLERYDEKTARLATVVLQLERNDDAHLGASTAITTRAAVSREERLEQLRREIAIVRSEGRGQ